MAPILRVLRWVGLPASAVTTLALLSCLAASVTVATRHFGLAALLLAVAAGLWFSRRWLGSEARTPVRPAQSWLGQRSLARNAISSGVATGADFVTMTLLVAALGVYVPLATFVGCAVGAVVNFTLSWLWAFGSDAALMRMAPRYALVSASSASLNAALVAVVLLVPHAPYQLAWLSVRAVVFVLWNYPLHRDYVFPVSERAIGS